MISGVTTEEHARRRAHETWRLPLLTYDRLPPIRKRYIEDGNGLGCSSILADRCRRCCGTSVARWRRLGSVGDSRCDRGVAESTLSDVMWLLKQCELNLTSRKYISTLISISGCPAILVYLPFPSFFAHSYFPSFSYNFPVIPIFCVFFANFVTNVKTLRMPELGKFCHDYQNVVKVHEFMLNIPGKLKFYMANHIIL